MMLDSDIELLEGMPIAYIRSMRALAVADMHLGYEGVMAKGGTLIPKVNFRKVTEMLSRALAKTGARSIIVDGDIKNEFSTVDIEEFNELYDLIQFAKSKEVHLVLIKGNHDNFVERYKEPFKLEIYRQEAAIDGYLFFHGEELPSNVPARAKLLIMGHEHPAIAVYSAIGRKEKLRCFLYGTYKGRRLLVLPAINYFASGTEINLRDKGELLSPVFRHVDVDSMHAIAIGYGSTIDFGTIGQLREAAYAPGH